MKLALVSCSKNKYKKRMSAKDVYSKSHLFRLAFQYASLVADKVLILSAKYYVLEPEDIIPPYNLTLIGATNKYKRKWYDEVSLRLRLKYGDFGTIIFCCSPSYHKGIIPLMENIVYEFPVKGLPIGKQLAFYKNEIEKIKRKKMRTLI